MLHGTFNEQPTDLHAQLRHGLLERKTISPKLFCDNIKTNVTTFLNSNTKKTQFLDTLCKQGIVGVQLNDILTDDQYISVGSWLGELIPESHNSVQPYVKRRVLLDLISHNRHTTDVAIQPFSTTYLTLHTESSAQHIENQPRYIVLMCCDPGDNATNTLTILKPMHSVIKKLSLMEIDILMKTKYHGYKNNPTILHSYRNNLVFSFRDYYPQSIEWMFDGKEMGKKNINQCIQSLLTAMYTTDDILGISWKRGKLVIIDNTAFFHGRIAGLNALSKANQRHLRRLRVKKSNA